METRAEKKERLIGYIKSNLLITNVEIGNALGINEANVRSIMKRNGISRTPEQLLEVQRLIGSRNTSYLDTDSSKNGNWKGGLSKDNYRYKKIQVERYPEKISARKKVHWAVKTGKLVRKPCFCGEEKVFAHHEDYQKPLDVIWLCRKHHVEKHIAGGSLPQG